MERDRRGQRIVVLGGGGFLGSHVCARLIAEGAAVVAVDTWLTGREQNLEAIEGPGTLEVVTADAADVSIGGLVTAILHLASPASPPDYLRHPTETLRAGSVATLHAIDLAAAHDARLLFASTSEVYGDPLVHPQPETYTGNVDPTGPRAVYDEAKRFGEAAVAAAGCDGRVDAAIVRIFNTVGPQMRPDDGRMVPAFVAQLLDGGIVTIHGDGLQTRSVADVEDTIDGLVRVLDAPVTGPINIGNPEEHTVLEVARWCGEALDVAVEHRFVPAMRGDPVRRCPDISLATGLLGWRPRVAARDAVVRAARWLAGERVSP
ncbi:MAG TPA: NAD-dependent epimerase/dehydratase family protein [Actinomycetota bacterium]|nr:NAD-dependent epimerase/dehydratase family protein [Actinomycetota bacterium]